VGAANRASESATISAIFRKKSGTGFSGCSVFKITPVKSTIKFAVKASVPIESDFEKWDATFTMRSTAVESGVLDVKIQAASVNIGSGMKDRKLKSKDFFDVDQDPVIKLHSTKIVPPAPTPLTFWAHSLFAMSPSRKHCTGAFPANEQATARLQEQWRLTARTLG